MKTFTFAELRNRVEPICRDPMLYKWGKKTNMKGVDWYGIRKEWDRWNCPMYEDAEMAFKLQLYFGDYLPATKAMFKAFPTLMMLFKEMTGLETFFASCDEATEFAINNWELMLSILNDVIMPVIGSFSKSPSHPYFL